MENYRIISNVKERDGRGGKPALVVKDSNFIVKELCPKEVTVPVGVEAVWILMRRKKQNPKSPINNIIVCSYYYPGPKKSSKELLYDHMAESIPFLSAKYGPKVDFILCADSNRLDLTPILQLLPQLKQVVTVLTRMNPPFNIRHNHYFTPKVLQSPCFPFFQLSMVLK